MQTYCLSCKKTQRQFWLKKSNNDKVVGQASAVKSRFKQKPNKKGGWNKINPKLLTY